MAAPAEEEPSGAPAAPPGGDADVQGLEAAGRSLLLQTGGAGTCHVQELAAEGELTVWKETKATFAMGVPLAFSQAARQVQDLSNAMVLGHYDTDVLAAISVASIWTNLTDVVLFNGLTQLSTLCGQAFGARNYGLVGTWLQIYLVFVSLAALIPLGLRWLTEPIMGLLGVPHHVAKLAGEYTIYSQAAFVFELWYSAVKEYYASQGIVRPDAVVDAIFIAVNLGMVGFFVFVLDMGIVGCGIATTISRCLRTLVYVAFCWSMGYHKQTWKGWSWKEIFVPERWRKLLELTLPAGLSGLMEELQFEAISVLAARMGAVESAALNLILSLLMFCFLFSVSTGEAVGIRTSQYLGAGRPEAARFASLVGITSITLGSVVLGGLFALVLFEPFVHIASNDPAVRYQMGRGTWIFSVTVAMLGAFFPIFMVLMKSGRTLVGGVVVAASCWLLGFPCSVLLSKKYGLIGIIDGLFAGYALANACLLIAYLRSDWPALALEAQRCAETEPSASPQGVVADEPEPSPEASPEDSRDEASA